MRRVGPPRALAPRTRRPLPAPCAPCPNAPSLPPLRPLPAPCPLPPIAPHAMFPAGWPGIGLVDPWSWRGTQ